MKLHKNQLDLIRLNIMTYEDCLKFLDTENTGDMIAMSYVFRPLTKNGYVVKGKDEVVAVLRKGRDLLPAEESPDYVYCMCPECVCGWKRTVFPSPENCWIRKNPTSFLLPVGGISQREFCPQPGSQKVPTFVLPKVGSKWYIPASILYS
ncbi:MAG: hypothetical protein IKC09_07410 [Oscillospiraceae bacterium]|nr:hypothetical protein [Oscillospiraceae bacterium]